MADLDLEELKRLVEDMSGRISPEMAKHDVAIKLVLASVDIMSELIARVERAEKALRRVAPFLDCIIDYTSGLEYEGNAAVHEVNQALGALTGDTPND